MSFRYSFIFFNLILILILVNKQSSAKISGRVYGGRPATDEEKAHLVALLFYGKHMCGASIIHKEKLLTAAHCFFQAFFHKFPIDTLSLKFNEVEFKMKDYQTHPKYVHLKANMGNDIAVIFLRKDISEYISGYKIMSPAIVTPTFGTKCVVVGGGLIYGTTIAQKPNWMQVVIAKWENCGPGDSPENKLCAVLVPNEYATLCRGDSGSALIHNDNQIVGILSYGQAVDCGKTTEHVFTDVAHYKNWIETVKSECVNNASQTKILIFILIIALFNL